MQLWADFHTHTVYSHGQGSVQENVQAAYKAGLRAVGITDHGPANLFGVGVRGLNMFARIRQDAQRAALATPGLQVLVGVEANVVGTNGQLDIPAWLQAELDIVLAGLHVLVRPQMYWPAAQLAGKNLLARAWQGGRKAALVANTDALVAAVYKNRIHIVTHPGYRLPVDTKELAKACAARNTAMEVNTSHPHNTTDYVRLVFEAGAKLVVNSDAHEPGRVGDLAAGQQLLKKADIPVCAVINACIK